MSAALLRVLKRPRSLALAASLWASLCVLPAQADPGAQTPLAQRLAEIREVNRFIPERALPMLQAIDAEGRAAPLPERTEFLNQLAAAQYALGHDALALATTNELIELGRTHQDNAALAKGTLRKGYIAFGEHRLAESHRLIWEAERLAKTTQDFDLRLRTTISSGESYAEDGNLPVALERLESAAAMAREKGDPVQVVMALNALVRLYGTMREFDKGFRLLEEATTIALKTNSPGRMATLKSAEYGLAIETKQYQRALRALQHGIALERQIGAHSMVAYSLVNLSDCYLKMHDFRNAASYAEQTIEAARRLNDPGLETTARLNLGQALMGLGRLAEGKRQMEIGMQGYEASGAKPELQAVLVEYGSALERAGDLAGALRAYHRERKLSNELFEQRRQEAMLDLQQKYEADKKQRQIELLRSENQVKSAEIDNRRLQQRIWWLLALVFALASAVVGLLYRKVRHANAALHEKNRELKQQSVRDPLTGLYNRRHFLEFMRSLPASGAGCLHEEQTGALFLLDVDHFKHINDTHGHAAGDAVLTAISNGLREILRETDMIVRWGGEEFLAYLPTIPRGGLDEVAQRILNGVSEIRIPYGDGTLTVHVSIGFAPFPIAVGAQMLAWERVVNLVDMALYLAKSHGRNRAYGVRGFADPHKACIDEIERNLEQAWRAGQVDLSVVLGGEWKELRVVSA
ncbi:GGDEF domain-containing protein [Massilia sp. KIM]|uniref:diguanylate cyclase n=1 Tax=Massilia sp. KIM TaxID=1955422 RepID=UPI00098ED18E|nr:diguanylate cyclase [Massilia sp. KIM]OON60843.1 GGDEF domain-containing protein [Massilia sp. KIM]